MNPNLAMDTADQLQVELGLPFDVTLLPTAFPPLGELRRWVYPAEG
jgi:hypothetical protein